MPDNALPVPVEAMNPSQQIAMIMGKYIGDQAPLDCVGALNQLSINGGIVEVRFDAWDTPEKYDGIAHLANVISGTSFYIEEINYIMPGRTK